MCRQLSHIITVTSNQIKSYALPILQAELEVSAENGATVTITLPDTGRQVPVAVGQEWVAVPGTVGAAAATYFVKWVQDETGALAVLQVMANGSRGHHGDRRTGAALAPVTA